MGKTKRDNLKYEVGKAYHNIERAIGNLQGLHETFKPGHPQHALMLETIASTLVLSQSLLEKFCVHTWGMIPKTMRIDTEEDATTA